MLKKDYLKQKTILLALLSSLTLTGCSAHDIMFNGYNLEEEYIQKKDLYQYKFLKIKYTNEEVISYISVVDFNIFLTDKVYYDILTGQEVLRCDMKSDEILTPDVISCEKKSISLFLNDDKNDKYTKQELIKIKKLME